MADEKDWYNRSFAGEDFSRARLEFDLMKAERDVLFDLLVDSLPDPVQRALVWGGRLQEEITRLAEDQVGALRAEGPRGMSQRDISERRDA